MPQDNHFSKRFTFAGCQMRVRWSSSTAELRFYLRTINRCYAKGLIQRVTPLEIESSSPSGVPLGTFGDRRRGTYRDKCGKYIAWKGKPAYEPATAVEVTVTARSTTNTLKLKRNGRRLPRQHTC